MIKQTSRLFALVVFLLFSINVLAQTRYSQMFVFGDSFSDIGNYGQGVGDLPSPPYFENRLSNGEVAVEILADRLGLPLAPFGLNRTGNNYAVATARAAGMNDFDLAGQIGMFLVKHGNKAPDDALYVVFIGGNDLRDARDTDEFVEAKAMVRAASESVARAINGLVLAGAQKILLVNSPNIGVIPETRFLSKINRDPRLRNKSRKLSRLYRGQLRKIAQQYNKDSKSAVHAGQLGEIEIIEFDLFRFVRKVLKKAPKIGISNTTDACFKILLVGGNFSINPGFDHGCANGENIDEYFFVDSIHPTAVIHALVGYAFYSAVMHRWSDYELNHRNLPGWNRSLLLKSRRWNKR